MEKIQLNKIYQVKKDFSVNLPPIYNIKLKKGEKVKFTGKLLYGDGRFERVPMPKINGIFEGSFILHHKNIFKYLEELKKGGENGNKE